MSRGMLQGVGIACLIVGVSGSVWAAHHPSSDLDHMRISSAYLPSAGEFEIYQVTEFQNDGAAKSTKTFTRFEYGITDDLVVEFIVPFRFRRPASGAATEGVGDVALEAKYRLVREPEQPFSLAVGFEVGFPTGDAGRGLGHGNFMYEPILSVGKIFDAFSLHQDAKLELVRETGGGVTREGSTTSAIAWTPVDAFLGIEHPTLSLALDWKFEEAVRTKLALVPGVEGEFEHLPIELEWRLGVPIGLNNAADAWGVILALEVEF